MPLNSFLAAPGSPNRLLRCAARPKWPASPSNHVRLWLAEPTRHPISQRYSRFSPGSVSKDLSHTQAHLETRRAYSATNSNNAVPDNNIHSPSLSPEIDSIKGSEHGCFVSQSLQEENYEGQSQNRLGSMQRKKRRLSRPARVLQSIKTSARMMYLNPKTGRSDLSYQRPGRFIGDVARKARRSRRHKGAPLEEKQNLDLPEPISTYTILARYLDHRCGADLGFTLTELEKDLLHRLGFDLANVESWATCLLDRNSHRATYLFKHSNQTPPLFVLLLFLRRRSLNRFAIGVIMRHLDERVSSKPLTWAALKILSVRLLRHVRQQWPETIPWIATFFVTQASAMVQKSDLNLASPRQISDITRFTNVLLHLLSLPANIAPVLSAIYQEKAQFQVLQFMANCTPAITVTQLGFRSVARNQLAHPKTATERDWAELKGRSWPPWKENRTAMDEYKGYAFGASRASKILHRMYEAGYRGHIWEEMVEVYAGWDTDSSPTIQTRTSLPHLSSPRHSKRYITELLWSARVRSTRTRREAWACFLAYELSNAPVSSYVYLAMFEKLHYPALERSSTWKKQSNLDEMLTVDQEANEAENDLLPGDMKEVIPDPTSPLHYVYLSEPIPSIEELTDRMQRQGLRPSGRLLAFFLESLPSFQSCIHVLELAKDDFNGGVGHLVSGQHGPDSCAGLLPGYLLAAFIRCLCRFGLCPPSGPAEILNLSPDRHVSELKSNRHYLLRYAYVLLSLYRPLYRPAWTAYMDVISRRYNETRTRDDGHLIRSDEVMIQYETIWGLVEALEETDLGIDGRGFQRACAITSYAVRATRTSKADAGKFKYLQSLGSRRLRTLFHTLVGADRDTQRGTTLDMEESNTIPPHIPSPADLHAYVRALGMLRDYEGLYSFSTWLTRHHTEVIALANAQYSGRRWLFTTLVALRAAVTGALEGGRHTRSGAPDDIVQLVMSQIDSVEEWGGWPELQYVEEYNNGRYLKSRLPTVGGR
ncbi:hypothetical protein HBI20_213390 [Parastagonospora nodorum]|nr:hypothetical protein HBI78_214170 [Parastagonospora nodorum]KAH5706749.1 hypothetical protein HBI20_213390 [Parastagonospora nodorum]